MFGSAKPHGGFGVISQDGFGAKADGSLDRGLPPDNSGSGLERCEEWPRNAEL
jgi:hypothetical protein